MSRSQRRLYEVINGLRAAQSASLCSKIHKKRKVFSPSSLIYIKVFRTERVKVDIHYP